MIDIASISYNKPRLVAEQIRLLNAYLLDDFMLTVFDNSSDRDAARHIEGECRERHVDYERLAVPDNRHDYALNIAAKRLLSRDAPYIGFLDHDVYPVRPTSLIPLIDKAGFYGIGQRHSPTNSLYLFPGFAFFKREWLSSKEPLVLNFGGIRGNEKADDGDCGSMNAPLFDGEDWRNLFLPEHGYGLLREPDDHGLQSFGYERLGDWIHLSNGSDWKSDVPDFAERERLAHEMLAAL